jgi:hypothetical protein
MVKKDGKKMAKLFVVKPVLGAKKKAFLEANGFTKQKGQWVKEGAKQELYDFWDEVDVYKNPQARFKYDREWVGGMIKTNTHGYYVHNDMELDFYLEAKAA